MMTEFIDEYLIARRLDGTELKDIGHRYFLYLAIILMTLLMFTLTILTIVT